jgi:hypothetical protein
LGTVGEEIALLAASSEPDRSLTVAGGSKKDTIPQAEHIGRDMGWGGASE